MGGPGSGRKKGSGSGLKVKKYKSSTTANAAAKNSKIAKDKRYAAFKKKQDIALRKAGIIGRYNPGMD